MKKFIENVKNLVAENEIQASTKQAVLDIAAEKGAIVVEKVLETAIVNTQRPLDRLFYEKIYKMLDRHFVTKRIIAKFSIN